MDAGSFSAAIEWYLQDEGKTLPASKSVCPTRDVFHARLDTFYNEMTAKDLLNETEASLLTAVVGEIGNNCFDHNLGQWKDEIGCWFSWEIREGAAFCVIADRGQGVLQTLKRVQPTLSNEEEALKLAFEKRISGRSPEQRGNGLKFVRSAVNGNDKRGLIFSSGAEGIRFGGSSDIEKSDVLSKMKTKKRTGTFALIVWNRP